MSDEATSLFEWDSGLVDDVDWTIESAKFTYNSKMGEDLVLELTGTYKDAETGETAETTQFYKCGSGWEMADGGATARREDGRSKLFNSRTGIVEFIRNAVEAGVKEKEIVSAGGPTKVDWLLGRTFHMNQKQFSGTFDGEKKEWFKFLPTSVVKGASATPKTTASKSAPAAEAASEGVSPALKAKLVKLAKESDNHDAFIDAAFSQFESDVSGNGAAEALVVDPSFYNEAQ